MPDATPLFTIVLAAGKGRRMRNRYMHKVCFDIAGVPTIVRALDTFNRLGVTQNVVVVGDMAGQVVETVGERFSNVVFAYQAQALGTGDASRCGLQALSTAPDDVRVLVVAGDKIIDSTMIATLVREFDATRADLQILVSPAALGGESAGRILLDGQGRPVGIAEMADIRLRACRQAMCDFLRETSDAKVPRESLQALIVRHLQKPVTLETILDRTADPESVHEIGSSWVDRQAALQILEELPRGFTVLGGTRFIAPSRRWTPRSAMNRFTSCAKVLWRTACSTWAPTTPRANSTSPMRSARSSRRGRTTDCVFRPGLSPPVTRTT